MPTTKSLLAFSVALGLAQVAPVERASAQAVQFGNPLAVPPSTPAATSGDRNIKILEVEGRGGTELQARRSAIEAAVEQAVGVFIDSRRRSEMNFTNDKLHQVIEERIQTYSSAFVERVESISSSSDGQGGYVVKLRAHVSIPSLLAAVKEADLPVVAIDAASNQTKFATQARMKEDASNVAAARLRGTVNLLD